MECGIEPLCRLWRAAAEQVQDDQAVLVVSRHQSKGEVHWPSDRTMSGMRREALAETECHRSLCGMREVVAEVAARADRQTGVE